MTEKNQRLSYYDYHTFREKANFYGGILAGAIAPVVFLRYTFFSGESKTIPEEIVRWITSSACAIPLEVFTLPVGAVLGIT